MVDDEVFEERFGDYIAMAEEEEEASPGVEDTTPDALWQATRKVSGVVPQGGAANVEDDVLPDPPIPTDRADTVVPVRPSPLPPPLPAVEVEIVPSRSSLIERVRESAVLQLVVLLLLGAVVLVVLLFPGQETAAKPALTPIPTFPKLEVEGAPPVTEKEIARRMQMADAREAEAERVKEPAVSFSELKTDEEKRAYLKAVAAAGREKVLGPAAGREGAGDVGFAQPAGIETAGRLEGDAPARRERAVFRWFTPGGTVKIEGAEEEKAQRQLPLGVGDRLFAKLEVGISSGHGAPVLARLTKEVESEGRVVAAKGAMLKGRFRADALRIYITFDELILPGGEQLVFEGYAVDRKVPGLLATRREIEGEPGKAVLQETVDVAKEVVRSVTGGTIVGRVTEGVAEGVLPDEQSAEQAGFILEVPAGKRFEVVVTKGGRS